MTLLHTDARDLSDIPDDFVQCVVTSPPYFGLRDYGISGQIGLEPTPDAYVAQIVAVFREVRRVLKDDGTVWLNLGDSYAGGGTAGSAAAFKGKQGTNRGSVGMIGPAKMLPGVKPKDLLGIPWRVAFALQADGWYLRSDIIWHKPNPMPESVTDRPTKSHEYLFLLAKSESYYYDIEAIKEPCVTSAELQVAKRNKKSHKGQSDPGGHRETTGGFDKITKVYEKRNRRTVWSITTKPYRGAHFATFPEALVEPCVLAGSRVGDYVLDPFCGSGTVGVVCEKNGRDFVGCDLNPEYLALAEARIAAAKVA